MRSTVWVIAFLTVINLLSIVVNIYWLQVTFDTHFYLERVKEQQIIKEQQIRSIQLPILYTPLLEPD